MVGPNRMPTPPEMTPLEVIAENMAWLRQIAKDGLERGFEKLNADLNGIADEIDESVEELVKDREEDE